MNPQHEPLIDPDCAICGAPGSELCECESNNLAVAVKRAEEVMLTRCLKEIREWVKIRARNFILDYYGKLEDHHEKEYCTILNDLRNRFSPYHNSPRYYEELGRLDAELKYNINEAWRASVQRYPEVLQYFYSLVDISRPDDSDDVVTRPPIYFNGEVTSDMPRNVSSRVSEIEYDPKPRRQEQRVERVLHTVIEENLPRSERTTDTRGEFRDRYRSRSSRKHGYD